MISPVLLLCARLVARVSAECTREMLQSATAAYIASQAASSGSLTALLTSVNYTQNDVITDIRKGILSQPLIIDFNRSLHDTTQCATFTELSCATKKPSYVIHTRMLFTDDKIITIQSVVTTDGDWAFNATGQLKWSKPEKWDPIPTAKQDTRKVIQALGDAYLDSWADASVKPPYGAPRARLEGGSYTSTATGTTNTCTMPAFPKPFKGCGNRLYVIDEEVGGLDIFNDFPFIDKNKPDGTPRTNLIRVENGQIRYIHEVTKCSTKNCGR